MTVLARNGHSRRLLALPIEAEWRKHAAGVVPAQPKARPEGQRSIGTPLAQQERLQVDQKDEPQSIFLTKLLPAKRISAERPTSAPPPKQNICRQIAEGIAS